MESQLPTPRLGHEQAPTQHSQGEQIQPYVGSELNRERYVEQNEQQLDPSAAAAAAVAIVLPTPIAPTAVSTSDPVASVATDDNPLTAGDDDLIEKEWVDKAKRIISNTHDDPHRREEEISRLQADYLRKRYGKELGSPH